MIKLSLSGQLAQHLRNMRNLTADRFWLDSIIANAESTHSTRGGPRIWFLQVGFTDDWRLPLPSERLSILSLEFANTAMGILFLAIWLLVGHILTLDHP